MILMKTKEVVDSIGFSRATLFSKIKDKSFPPPISIDGAYNCWADYEIQLMQDAYIAGMEVDAVITFIVGKRKALKESLMQEL